jgi:hypothetical protein
VPVTGEQSPQLRERTETAHETAIGRALGFAV